VEGFYSDPATMMIDSSFTNSNERVQLMNQSCVTHIAIHDDDKDKIIVIFESLLSGWFPLKFDQQKMPEVNRKSMNESFIASGFL
jgi:hypothetical protein